MRILVVDDFLEDEDMRSFFKMRLTLIPLATACGVDTETLREILDKQLARDDFELPFVFHGDEAPAHYRQHCPCDLRAKRSLPSGYR